MNGYEEANDSTMALGSAWGRRAGALTEIFMKKFACATQLPGRLFARAGRALIGGADASAAGIGAFDRCEPREMMTVNVVTPVNDFLVFQGSSPTVIRVDDRFNDPDVNGQVVRYDTVLGDIFVELFQQQTPISAANFLRYVDASRYSDTIFHRSFPGFIIQGGGFQFPGFGSIESFGQIQNEPVLSNIRGTIAMAKRGGDPNSATSQWFFNLADNASNLDNQNGGFTVFGEVLGNGMSVVDAIAALPLEDLGEPFNEIPLRNFTGGTPTIDNVILIRSITRASELIFSATSTNSALVTPTFVTEDGQQRLQLAYGAGTGDSTITIRAEARDGTFTTQSVTIRVVDQALASPTVGEVRVNPAFVDGPGPGSNITLTALNVRDNDGTVSLIEYYRDNGDGAFNADTDTLLGSATNANNQYSLSVPTVANANTARYFARARDNDFLFSLAATVTNTQNTAPTVGSLTFSMSTIIRPESISIIAGNVSDTSGSIQRVEFWRDINGNGVFDSATDQIIGPATFRSGTYRATVATNLFPAGAIPILAVAFDAQGLTGVRSATLTVTNLVPTFEGIQGGTNVAVRGQSFQLRVLRAQDRDGVLQGAEYFRDVNNNGVIDAGVDILLGRGENIANNYEATLNSSQFELGNNRILVGVVDDDGVRSAVQSITIRVNRAPSIASISLLASQVVTNGVVNITANNANDPDGTIASVEFFWDRDNNQRLDTTLFDTRLGNGIKSGNNWRYFFNASILYDNFANRLFAQSIDNLGVRSPAVPVIVTIVRPGQPEAASENPYIPSNFRMPDGTLVTDVPLPRGVDGAVRRVSAAFEVITPLPALAGSSQSPTQGLDGLMTSRSGEGRGGLDSSTTNVSQRSLLAQGQTRTQNEQLTLIPQWARNKAWMPWLR